METRIEDALLPHAPAARGDGGIVRVYDHLAGRAVYRQQVPLAHLGQRGVRANHRRQVQRTGQDRHVTRRPALLGDHRQRVLGCQQGGLGRRQVARHYDARGRARPFARQVCQQPPAEVFHVRSALPKIIVLQSLKLRHQLPDGARNGLLGGKTLAFDRLLDRARQHGVVEQEQVYAEDLCLFFSRGGGETGGQIPQLFPAGLEGGGQARQFRLGTGPGPVPASSRCSRQTTARPTAMPGAAPMPCIRIMRGGSPSNGREEPVRLRSRA